MPRRTCPLWSCLTNVMLALQIEFAAPMSLGGAVAITDAEGNVMVSAGKEGAVLAVISADDQHWSDYLQAAAAA